MKVILWILEVVLSLMSAYVVALTMAAFLHRRTENAERLPTKRFALLIPAHDEELLLGKLLKSIANLDYPTNLFRVCVVADNCSDDTANVARSHGARVFERRDEELIGKGYALSYLLDRVTSGDEEYDAFVVLDADSSISSNFLSVMNHKLLTGSLVVQAYYTVANPTESWATTLRYIALALLHYLRPLGKSLFGGSAGLKGNGMCFSRSVAVERGWNTFGLTEDLEYHLKLVSSGIKVDFAPEAIVLAQMPSSLRRAGSQNLRWERGRLDVMRRSVAHLLLSGVSSRNLAQVDAGLELLVPPFSVPVALSVLCLLGGFTVGSEPLVIAAFALILAQSGYVFGGLVLVRAPIRVYLALLRAPLYIGWKVWLYAFAVLSTDHQRWVRTPRF